MLLLRSCLLLLSLVVAAGAHGITTDPVQARIEHLRADLARHDTLYFKQAAPEITDAAYDQLRQELTALESANPSPDPTTTAVETIGDDCLGAFPTYRHGERMLSLDKCYSETELRAFHERVVRQVGGAGVTCVVEPKYDGVAISAIYQHGTFVRAVTRGNGVEGDDVTANVLMIGVWPRQLRPIALDGSINPVPDLIELRGEIYLPLAEFARLNRERDAAGEAPYAHPRNLAAGTLKQLDPQEIAGRELAVVFYGWGAWEPAAARPDSQQEFHRCVKQWGLPGVEKYWTAHDADEMWAAVQEFGRERGTLGFPCDGAVVKVDAVASQRALGASSRAPHWATAYKYSPERVETHLRAITLQVGRTGVLTPVAEFDPVLLGGATISRASLYNRVEIIRRDIRIGDTVIVEKAGEIIPAVVGVNVMGRTAASRPFVFPTICPACQAPLVGNTEDAAVRCPNYDCPAQLLRRLQHFASENGVGIVGLGPVTIESLVTKGCVKAIPDLYRLHCDELTTRIPALGNGQSAERLLAAIERSKRAELWRFILGFGIPRVGKATAKDLAERFDGLESLLKESVGGESAESGRSRGLSPAVAATLATYFSEPRNRAMITELIAAGVQPVSTHPEAAMVGILASVNFALLGTPVVEEQKFWQ